MLENEIFTTFYKGMALLSGWVFSRLLDVNIDEDRDPTLMLPEERVEGLVSALTEATGPQITNNSASNIATPVCRK
jgi:hypothetical protein